MKDFCKKMSSDGEKRVKVIAVTGPTATGKTALGVRLARKFNGEIISVDSRQVYRGLDIGSGKDICEYQEIPYHLIDIADPAREVYNLARFCRDAFAAIADIVQRGKVPILCGGTALYLLALLDGYTLPGEELPPRCSGLPRPKQDQEKKDSFQPPFVLDPLLLGVYFPRKEVRERIQIRLDKRLAEGMLEEEKKLLASGVTLQQLEFFGLEYREMALYCAGKCSLEEMREVLLNKIRQFAKRQDIFFRKMEREGHVIHWLLRGEPEKAEKLAALFLQGQPLPPVDFKLVDIINPDTRRP